MKILTKIKTTNPIAVLRRKIFLKFLYKIFTAIDETPINATDYQLALALLIKL